jgi:PadR family transcriptional regulator PadR
MAIAEVGVSRTGNLPEGITPSRELATPQSGTTPPSLTETVTQTLTVALNLCRVSTMGKEMPRVTTQTLRVLGAFTTSRDDELSGAMIAKKTGLQSGTLYPILARLEQAKWLESEWEVGDPRELGRPRRRLYRLTGFGAKNAESAFREVTKMIGGRAWQHP